MKKNIIQTWKNPAWKSRDCYYILRKGYPDGYFMRIGRLVIKFGGTKV